MITPSYFLSLSLLSAVKDMQNNNGETQRPEVSMGDNRLKISFDRSMLLQNAKHGPKNFIQ